MNKLYISLGVLLSLLASNVQLRASDLLDFTYNSLDPRFNDIASWSNAVDSTGSPAECFTSVSGLSSLSGNGSTSVMASGSGNISWNQQGMASPATPGGPGCYSFDNSDPQMLTADEGWYGNFSPGDALVWSYDLNLGLSSGPITLALSQGVVGIGTQFQVNTYLPFTAQLTVFDGNTEIGSFTNTFGLSNGAADNSAIFLGVFDLTGANITSVVASIVPESCQSSGCDPMDFAINQVSLSEPQSPVSTPEPASVLLLGSGLVGIAWIKLRQRFLNE